MRGVTVGKSEEGAVRSVTLRDDTEHVVGFGVQGPLSITQLVPTSKHFPKSFL